MTLTGLGANAGGGGGGGGAVSSVFGRTGAVVAVDGDYDDSQILISGWQSGVTYSRGQRAVGVDNNVYFSLVNSNIGHNPVGDGGVHWQLLGGNTAGGYLAPPVQFGPASGGGVTAPATTPALVDTSLQCTVTVPPNGEVFCRMTAFGSSSSANLFWQVMSGGSGVGDPVNVASSQTGPASRGVLLTMLTPGASLTLGFGHFHLGGGSAATLADDGVSGSFAGPATFEVFSTVPIVAGSTVSVERLNFSQTVDVSAVPLTTTAWTDVITDIPNFASTGGDVYIYVRTGMLAGPMNGENTALRLVVDSTPYQLTNGLSANGASYINYVGGVVRIPGLSASSAHTIKAQIYTDSVGADAYCRPATTPNTEFFNIQIVEGGLASLPAEKWTAITGGVGYQNSWADLGGAGAPGGFSRSVEGRVSLHGVINGGLSGTVVCTLPVGFRPAATEYLACAVIGTGGTPAPGFMSVDNSGNVTVAFTGTITGGGGIGLAGGSFLAGN